MIRLDNIVKTYIIDKENSFTALKSVSIEIQEREFVAITGPSGCGKSTLMHMIGLLDKPTNGNIYINDVKVDYTHDDSVSMLRSETIGFVFQQFNLIPKLSILENVLLPTVYYKKQLSFNPIDRAKYLLTRFGLESKMDSRPNKISGGQQQRVAIARALVMNPNIILADEPTGNLDTKTGDEIMKLLQELNEEGTTIVLVTHESDIAAKAKRIIKMRDGEIEL